MTTYPSGSKGFQTGQPRSPRPETGFPRDSTGVRRELNARTRVDHESEGRRFESCRARYELPGNTAFMLRKIHSGSARTTHLTTYLFSKPPRMPPFGVPGSPWIRTLGTSHEYAFGSAAIGLMPDSTRATRPLKPYYYALFETFLSLAIALRENSEV